MPKGSKICPTCQNKCGVRSYHCIECGHGFEVNGIQFSDYSSGLYTDEGHVASAKLMRHIVKIPPYKGGYGEELIVWESLCHTYQILYYTHRFGVCLHDTKHYHLILNNGIFEPVARHRSLGASINAMIKHRRTQDGH